MRVVACSSPVASKCGQRRRSVVDRESGRVQIPNCMTYTCDVTFSQDELNERITRAVAARRTLRRATVKLLAFGVQLLEIREAERRDRSR